MGVFGKVHRLCCPKRGIFDNCKLQATKWSSKRLTSWYWIENRMKQCLDSMRSGSWPAWGEGVALSHAQIWGEGKAWQRGLAARKRRDQPCLTFGVREGSIPYSKCETMGVSVEKKVPEGWRQGVPRTVTGAIGVRASDVQHIVQRRLKQPTFTRGLECIEVRVCVWVSVW